MLKLAHTSIVSVVLAAGSLGPAYAEVRTNEAVVHETTTSVEVDINHDTLICSRADYSLPMLKLLVPELAGLTLLNHQNTGAGAPCVSSGECDEGNFPGDIIDPNKPTETIDIQVKAVRLENVDTDAKTCTTSLREDVTMVVRGRTFTHARWSNLGSRPFADCTGTPTDPEAGGEKADGTAGGTAGETETQAGGCSAGGASQGFGVMILGALLGGVLAARRRRSVA